MMVKCIQSHLNSWNFPFFARISISNFHSAPRLETLVKMQLECERNLVFTWFMSWLILIRNRRLSWNWKLWVWHYHRRRCHHCIWVWGHPVSSAVNWRLIYWISLSSTRGDPCAPSTPTWYNTQLTILQTGFTLSGKSHKKEALKMAGNINLINWISLSSTCVDPHPCS